MTDTFVRFSPRFDSFSLTDEKDKYKITDSIWQEDIFCRTHDIRKERQNIMADLLNLDQLKAKAEQIVKQLTGNKDLIAAFTKDPTALLKQLGINIPQEQINKLIELVKEKLGDQTTQSILAKIKAFFKR